jgi:predicted enzyme involved in methoxymalonyl-ACP biosynthesis
MGRKVEQAMIHVLVELARAAHADSLQAEYLPTSKNQPCLAFLEASGMRKEFGNNGAPRFIWDLQQAYTKPSCVQLNVERTQTLAQASQSDSLHYA